LLDVVVGAQVCERHRSRKTHLEETAPAKLGLRKCAEVRECLDEGPDRPLGEIARADFGEIRVDDVKSTGAGFIEMPRSIRLPMDPEDRRARNQYMVRKPLKIDCGRPLAREPSGISFCRQKHPVWIVPLTNPISWSRSEPRLFVHEPGGQGEGALGISRQDLEQSWYLWIWRAVGAELKRWKPQTSFDVRERKHLVVGDSPRDCRYIFAKVSRNLIDPDHRSKVAAPDRSGFGKLCAPTAKDCLPPERLIVRSTRRLAWRPGEVPSGDLGARLPRHDGGSAANRLGVVDESFELIEIDYAIWA
jgi:hypothetical protein